MKTIAVDFHGVICSYVSGRVDPLRGEVSVDPPSPGAIEWLSRVSESYRVLIMCGQFAAPSTRSAALDSATRWLIKHGVPRQTIGREPDFSRKITLGWTRPKCVLSLDDRAIPFRGLFPSLREIADFRPWNLRDQTKGPNVNSMPLLVFDLPGSTSRYLIHVDRIIEIEVKPDGFAYLSLEETPSPLIVRTDCPSFAKLWTLVANA